MAQGSFPDKSVHVVDAGIGMSGTAEHIDPGYCVGF
jgi:hypothetical protein